MQASKVDKIDQALCQSHLFSSLNEEQLKRVRAGIVRIHLEEGQKLFDQGQAVKQFFMVLSGKIKLYRLSPDGQEKIIEIIGPGELFAEALMFMHRPSYPVSCAALHKAEIIGIDAENFKDMLTESVDTCLLLLGDMSYRLHQLVNEIDTLTLHSGACRVASYLMHNIPENSNSFKLDIPKNVIAARLSIKPETFSRIIKRLKNDGIISIRGSNITVNDFNALKNLGLG